jgi:hypothetical protein
MTLLPAANAYTLPHNWACEAFAWITIVPQPMVGRELRLHGKTLVQMHTMFADGSGIGFIHRLDRGFIVLNLVVS